MLTGKGSVTSWIITGAVVVVVLALFGGYLFYIYTQQQGELSKQTGFVIQDGEKVRVDSKYRRRQPPSPPPSSVVSRDNEFDSGKEELLEPADSSELKRLEMTNLIEKVEPSIVRIQVESDAEEGVGSGFFIDGEGKIVTNYHVVQGAIQVTVTTADHRQAEALGYLVADAPKDLAIIQVDPQDFDIVPIAIADVLPRKGEQVAAFGAPQGFSFSATTGTVSAIREGVEVRKTLLESTNFDLYNFLGYATDTTWIQTTAAISGGNSGGPLVNMKGQVVGINTWTHPGGQNLNFASTSAEVEEIFRERDGKIYAFNGTLPPKIRDRF